MPLYAEASVAKLCLLPLGFKFLEAASKSFLVPAVASEAAALS